MNLVRRIRQTARGTLAAGALAGLAGLALSAAPVMAQSPSTDGYIYGQVTTEGGETFEGRIRWGKHEAFWNDFFNSTKTRRSLPHGVESDARKREKIKVFGFTIGFRWSEYDRSRSFKARFGDIREIQVRGNDRAVVVMKSGTEFDVDGGSSDIGAKVNVWDKSLGAVGVEWKRIETVRFMPTPSDLKVDGHRIFGAVSSSVGNLTGFIQWDQDEGLSTDELDGDSRDADLSIEFGRIRTIERRSRNSARIVLTDDREFVLDDSNDVDSDNRGIFVVDPSIGHVLLPWGDFDRADLSVPKDSGPSYTDHAPGKMLYGTVTDRDGTTHRGRIVYDLDESETWEILDGNDGDIEYSIPMGLIASIEPLDRDSSRIVLRGGKSIDLEDTVDVGEGNAGILVFESEDQHLYIPWNEVEKITFDAAR